MESKKGEAMHKTMVERGFKSPPGVEPLFPEGFTGTAAEFVRERDKRTDARFPTIEDLDNCPFLLRNMVEENGRTIKQNNMERKHAIPIDTLVELENGVRMFVTKHTRDCDGTPLYALAEYQTTSEEGTPIYLSTGHGEDGLRIVKRAAKRSRRRHGGR
jgi:hypothetical protein